MWVKKVKLREPCLNHRPAEGQSWRGSRFCPCLWCRNCHPRPRWGGPGIAAGRAVSKGGVRALGPTCKWLELCLPVCSLGVKGRRSLGLPSCPSPACSLGHAGSRAASHVLARTLLLRAVAARVTRPRTHARSSVRSPPWLVREAPDSVSE